MKMEFQIRQKGESVLPEKFMKKPPSMEMCIRDRTEAYRAAGKTGSAEFETGKESHAWFTGFAPADDPKIAVTVIVEEGGSGGREAAPIARAVMDAYFTP